MAPRRLLIFAAIILTTFLVTKVQSITFDDGLVHVIDATNSFPLDAVFVFDESGGSPTTVKVVDGGQIATLTCEDSQINGSSRLEISGGEIGCFGGSSPDGGFILRNTSQALMTWGSVAFLIATDTASAEIRGGTLGTADAQLNARTSISGGDVNFFLVNGGHGEIVGGEVGSAVVNAGGRLNLLGGSVGPSAARTLPCEGNIKCALGAKEPGAVIQVLGGNVTGTIQAANMGEVNISGGTLIGVDIQASSSGTAIISGGQFDQSIITVFDTGNVTILGSGFNFPLGDVTATSGVVTGTLADGALFSMSFARSTGGKLTLAALEDSDSDGVGDGLDKCIDIANPDQADTDGNGVGDACNDAEDADGDEWADNLDNCPNDSNFDQSDADMDHVGDVCDPFPNDSNNRAAQCEADLADVLADTDADGVLDVVDACADTPNGETVDQLGCSLAQFCASIDMSAPQGAAYCIHSDWQNDEPIGNPQDCTTDAAAGLCVPR